MHAASTTRLQPWSEDNEYSELSTYQSFLNLLQYGAVLWGTVSLAERRNVHFKMCQHEGGTSVERNSRFCIIHSWLISQMFAVCSWSKTLTGLATNDYMGTMSWTELCQSTLLGDVAKNIWVRERISKTIHMSNHSVSFLEFSK